MFRGGKYSQRTESAGVKCHLRGAFVLVTHYNSAIVAVVDNLREVRRVIIATEVRWAFPSGAILKKQRCGRPRNIHVSLAERGRLTGRMDGCCTFTSMSRVDTGEMRVPTFIGSAGSVE